MRTLRLTTAALEPGRTLKDRVIRKWRLLENVGLQEGAARIFRATVEFTDGATMSVQVVRSATT